MLNKTIVIVSNTSWFIYNFHRTLLQRLKIDGYKIITIAPYDEYSQKLEVLGIEYHDIKINSKGTSPLEDTKLILSFYKLYKKIRPDILLHYTIKPNIYGSIAARMLKIPVISSITGLGTIFIKESVSSKIARMLYKVSLQFNKKVFFLNTYDQELFIGSKLIRPNISALMPGSGIDTNVFKPLKKTSKSNGKFRFLFVARLLKDKGLVEYVHAAQILSVKGEKDNDMESKKCSHDDGIEFCILGAYYPGNPTAISETEMQKWESDGVVKYLGTSDDVQSVIAECDCVVLPSYREGLSRVLLEAASMEKPIIASNVPGCKEVVDDGLNGYLCKVKSVDSLVKQMKKMISLSDDQKEEMGRRGREKVITQYDEKIVNDIYHHTIEELLH